MIRALTHAALRLDTWLQTRLGRPYNILLSAGLIAELVERIRHFPEKLASVHRLAGAVLLIATEIALLIHQIGALSHRLPRARSA